MNKKKEIAKQVIVDSCPVCHGNIKNPCIKCIKKISQIDKYSFSNIPVGYWNNDIYIFEGNKAFQKIAIEYIENIDKAYAIGKSYCFAGGVGRGKTLAACSILMYALNKNYSCWYDTMSLMVSKMRDSNDFKQSMLEVDFLVIDEVDSRFLPLSQAAIDFVSSSLETILRVRSQNLLPFIICTNEEDGNISANFNDMFKAVFSSLKSQYIETVFVGGKDFRKREE